MRAGTLRDRVRLEQFAPAGVDTTGGPVKEWTAIAERHAQIMAISGRELLGAGTEAAEATYRIRVREMPDLPLDPALRAVDVDRGDVFDIIAIIPTRLRNEVVLQCRVGGAKAP